MRIYLALLFIAFNVSLYAQPEVSEVVDVNGGKYYKHKVEEGNTLYGMQQMYGVPYSEIIEANPGFDGLKAGEYILIPYKGADQAEEEVISEYRVKNKETLYGLSKKFNTTVDHLIELNPELKDGLKKGQIIKVPGKVQEDVVENNQEVSTPNPFVVDTVENEAGTEKVIVKFSDSTVRHVVLAHETMYSISKRFMVSVDEIMKVNGLKSSSVKEGQVLVIPVKTERIAKVEIRSVPEDYDPNEPLEFEEKSSYNIALMLPLHLSYGKKYSEAVSNLATQFYMGAMMAVDSLERKGFKAKLYVYDTMDDSTMIQSLLNKPEFNSMDLVIGPLFGRNMGMVADFCKENRIRMACPVTANKELWQNNQLVYASVPTDETMIRGLARHILKTGSGDHVILIKPLDEKSHYLYDAFKDEFNEGAAAGVKPSLAETTVGSFNTQIIRGKENLFVIPTDDRSTAVKVFNQLNKSSFRAYKDDIFVYGTKEWVDYKELNDALKNKYNLRFASGNYLDYYTDPMVALNKAYRSRYKTDLSKYAVQGYDILTYYCSELFMGNEKPYLLMNQIHLNKKTEGSGFENTHVFILEQEEYELIKIDEVTLD